MVHDKSARIGDTTLAVARDLSNGGSYLRIISLLPIPALIVGICIAQVHEQLNVYEPPLLLPILNTVFLFTVACIVSFVAQRSYVAQGSMTILLLGCGVLALGSGALAAGWLIQPCGPNVGSTIFNIAALLCAGFHIASALRPREKSSLSSRAGRQKTIIACYAAVVAFIIMLSIAVVAGLLPEFIVPGVGPTTVRQLVMLIAFVLFTYSSLSSLGRFFREQMWFLYWYSLALGILAIAMIALFLPSPVGGITGWCGRIAQYLSGIYMLIAVFAAYRQSGGWHIPLEQALKESEDRLRTLTQASHEGIVLAEGGIIVDANDQLAQMHGYELSEVIGRHVGDFVSPQDRSRALASAHSAEPRTGEYVGVRKDGSEFRVLARGNAATYRGKPARVIVLRDITAAKQAQEALRQSEERLRLAMDAGRLAYWEIDLVTEEVIPSPRLFDLFGLAPVENREFREQWRKRIHQDDRQMLRDAVEQAARQGTPFDIQYRIGLPDGVRWHESKAIPVKDSTGKNVRLIGMVADITDRKQAEMERAANVDLLRLLNEAASTKELARSALDLFHRLSGCQAMGIRLKHGNDYPYYELSGFTDEFIHTENSLLCHDEAGVLVYDRNGSSYIECMCGNVICGRTDPSKPFFTAKGSFWTNGTTQLLAGTTEASRGTHTRNVCNRVGFESVAIVPLRHGGQTLGLLHLCDRREGMFSLSKIAAWEGLADQLATAFAKTQAEEALRQAKDELEQRVEERTAELMKAVAALGRRGEQLRQLASELTLAEHRERQRLAQVLHDDLQQLLVGAKFQLHALHRSDDAQVRQTAADVDRLLGESVICSRTLTSELSPSILQHDGLLPALEWLGQQMQEKHGLAVELICEEDAAPESDEMKILLFYSVRELLFNAVKHSKTASACVEVKQMSDGISLTVRDAGAGFDPCGLRMSGGTCGGFGLFSIMERLDLLGGRMDIDSAPGKGSRFTLWAPRGRSNVTV